MKIGLEVHVALPTKTKLFCGDLAYENQDTPNSNVCPICLGLPGSKPVLNKKALEVSLDIAHSLNCDIPKKTWFIRKVYFYPDLPKGYQITQLDGAVGSRGFVKIKNKKIGIRRVQIEEDPARITREKEYSLIDFNRSGIPLNEIVTEPDISSLEELKEFVDELRSILYYIGVDINQEIKTDLNISLAENRVEIKNVTGIKNLITAAEYEIKRQSNIISAGKDVYMETRTYNEETGETVSSREKETEEEYGFIFEPDLTFYETAFVELKTPIIASDIAVELSRKSGYSESTLKELIMFNKRNLEILLKASKDDLPKSIVLIEKFASFGAYVHSYEQFKEMLKYDISAMDKQQFISLLEGKETAKDFHADEIENYVIKLISQDISLNNRKDEKVVGFLIGKVKQQYNIDARTAGEIVRKAIKGRSGN